MANSVIIKRYEAVAFPTGYLWDRPLTDEEFERLNAPDKKARVYTALVRKIALLQSAAESADTIPASWVIPKNRKGLREWSDPDQGLWTWSYVKLDNPNGVNGNEIAAFFQALSDIDQRTKGKKSDLRRQLADSRALIQRLEVRNIQLLDRIGKLYALMDAAGVKYEHV